MEGLLAVLVGVLYATAVYMLLRRSIVKLLIGLVLLGNAANLLIFTGAGLVRGRPPLIPDGSAVPEGPVADPLAQALILTALVIGFGVLAFAVVLVRRAYEVIGRDDTEEMRDTDA
jgi:multicomponent Na+:H+ antiporter subunit C